MDQHVCVQVVVTTVKKKFPLGKKKAQSQWLYLKCHSAFPSPEDLSGSAKLKY